jgi:hypothetical protein
MGMTLELWRSPTGSPQFTTAPIATWSAPSPPAPTVFATRLVPVPVVRTVVVTRTVEVTRVVTVIADRNLDATQTVLADVADAEETRTALTPYATRTPRATATIFPNDTES